MRRSLLLAAAIFIFAPGCPDGGPDAGPDTDAGSPIADAGLADAGRPTVDGGQQPPACAITATDTTCSLVVAANEATVVTLPAGALTTLHVTASNSTSLRVRYTDESHQHELDTFDSDDLFLTLAPAHTGATTFGVAFMASTSGILELNATFAEPLESPPCAVGCKDWMQLPVPREDDGYINATATRYQWSRRDAVGAIRAAIRVEYHRDPTEGPILIGDLSQQDGLVPGADVGAPRHPAPSHTKGFSADIGYFRTDGNNSDDSPACPSTDRSFCEGPHVVDTARMARLFGELAAEPKLIQIIVDPIMEQDLRAAVGAASGGDISAARAAHVLSVLTSGQPFHADHFHIAVARECVDGIDNDGDGQVDGADPGCPTWDDDDESDG